MWPRCGPLHLQATPVLARHESHTASLHGPNAPPKYTLNIATNQRDIYIYIKYFWLRLPHHASAEVGGKGEGRGYPRAYSIMYSTVLPEQRIKDGGLTGRRAPVPVAIPISVSLVFVAVLPLRLRLVPDGVVGDLLAGALDPVPRRGQQIVRVLGADFI